MRCRVHGQAPSKRRKWLPFVMLPFGLALAVFQNGLQAQDSSDAPHPLTATDHADFYREFLPEVEVVQGGDQSGHPGSMLAEPISVKVAGGLQNAPVTFSVIKGEASLTANAQGSEKPTTSVDVQAIVPVPRSPGNFVAQVYVHLAPTAKNQCIITATVRSGAKTAQAQIKVDVSDPSVPPPTNFRLIKNTATTATYRWTPGDPALPVRIEISLDNGANWKAAGTFPAGSTEGTIYHIRPDSTVMCRARTVGKEDGAADQP